MSSRNRYLDSRQRKAATVLHRALMRVQQLADRGERDSAVLVRAAREVVAEQPGVRLDYVEAVNPETLEGLPDVSHGALIAIAAWLGTTRLIDNVVLVAPMQAAGPH